MVSLVSDFSIPVLSLCYAQLYKCFCSYWTEMKFARRAKALQSSYAHIALWAIIRTALNTLIRNLQVAALCSTAISSW